MQSLWPFMFGLLIGVGVGAIALARFWSKSLRNPELARKMLQEMYKNSHAHWLQVSQSDTRMVCPCCGWTQAEGKNSKVDEKKSANVPFIESSDEKPLEHRE